MHVCRPSSAPGSPVSRAQCGRDGCDDTAIGTITEGGVTILVCQDDYIAACAGSVGQAVER